MPEVHAPLPDAKAALVPSAAAVGAVVDDAVARYCAERRRRVDGFIDRNFSLIGALHLHRSAVGWDIARAPVNLTLAAPHLGAQAGAGVARRLGFRGTADWLGTRRFFLHTDVARELEWRLYTELFELPIRQGSRVSTHDALAAEILSDRHLAAANPGDGTPLDSAAGRAWLSGAVGTYEGTRVSAADLTNALITAGAGGLVFKKLTPGMMSLAPIVAQSLVHNAAVAGFPLGASAGAVWYGMFPAAAPVALTVGLTGGMMAAGAVLTAFSGVVTDPIQRRLGLHRRRLLRLVDCLETELGGSGDSRFVVRDHYVARVFDLVEVAGLAWRAAT